MLKLKPQSILVLSCLFAVYLSSPAFAYHPLSTDDPGTTEYRHFEFEWGNHLIMPEDIVEEYAGYVAIKSGLAPGLEFDTALNFTYWIDTGDNYTSGWGDVEMLLKYRFLGDGDGPYNMGVEVIGLFPSGEEDKGLSSGENITPTAFLFGSLGGGPFRVLLNLGGTSVPDENDTALYGTAIEYNVTEEFVFAAEIFGESDMEKGGGNDPLEAMAGMLYDPADWLTLSAGAGTGLAPDSPDLHLTFAVLVGW